MWAGLLLGYIYHRRTLSFFTAQFTLWFANARAQYLIQFGLNFFQPAFYGFSIGWLAKALPTHRASLPVAHLSPRPLHAANSASPPGHAKTFSTHSFLPVRAVHRPAFPCGRFLLGLASHFLIAAPRTAIIPPDHSPMPTYPTRSRTHSVFAARCAGSFKQICIAHFSLPEALEFWLIFSAY